MGHLDLGCVSEEGCRWCCGRHSNSKNDQHRNPLLTEARLLRIRSRLTPTLRTLPKNHLPTDSILNLRASPVGTTIGVGAKEKNKTKLWWPEQIYLGWYIIWAGGNIKSLGVECCQGPDFESTCVALCGTEYQYKHMYRVYRPWYEKWLPMVGPAEVAFL